MLILDVSDPVKNVRMFRGRERVETMLMMVEKGEKEREVRRVPGKKAKWGPANK